MTSPGRLSPVLTGQRVLRGLRGALHISVLTLLIIGLLGAVDAQTSMWRLLMLGGVVLVFSAVYALGIWAGRHLSVWLAAVTALWVVLLVLDLNFTWLAFPLFFLHMQLLRTRHAVISVIVLTGVVVAAQWASRGGPDLPALVGPVLGAGFAVVLALAYQGLYAENRAQQAALDELQRTREELSVSQREAGAMAERARMARDIHDTLAQGFSSVVLLARAASTSLENRDSGTAAQQIAAIRSTASENLDEARRFVRALQAGPEGGQSLTASLKRTCQMVEAEAAAHGETLRSRLVISGDPLPLDAAQGVALLRAGQASLSNVVKHARASTAVITVTYTDDQVMLDIVDDGVGFDTSAASAEVPRADGSGFGLLSLRERIAALSGDFTIESSPGEGTAVSIRLPLAGEETDG